MERNCHRLDYGHGGGGAIFYSSKSKRKPNGCMAAFYHLFDHHLTIDSSSRSNKGLKLIEESIPSTTYKDKPSLNIPVSMRVRTEIGTKSSRLRALATDSSTSSSEICNSPGSKTPNLVARLMGLDLLPDKTDLDHSLSNLHTMPSHHGSSRLTNHYHRLSNKGTRSLPVSPRISSARKSDFDIHRLSLQLNKENKHEDPRCSRLKQDQEENRSPRDYARHIVKQIKERVATRRVVGMDITNSVKNREASARPSLHELRRDTTVSCSPRTRFSDKENKPSSTNRKPNSSPSFRTEQIIQKPKPKPTTVILVSVSKSSGEKQSQNRAKQKQLKPINRCKKAENETRFTQRLIKHTSPTSHIRIKQRETVLSESKDVKAKPLHKKKFKKLPKSNVLENISDTRPPQKQINERDRPISNEDSSLCSSLIQSIEKNSPQVARNHKLNDVATEIDSEKDYITRIVNLAGIKTDSATTTLDPSIFRKLEQCGDYPSGSLALQCNRKLLFDLVNEILTKNVEAYAKRQGNNHGSELISELCSAVATYSSKSCQVALMDVDHLLETKKVDEEIVAEIEREIIDALVAEIESLNLSH
ncbi:hypothetical protein CARUB_v10026137mg [Capsella rubella]|uniref:DUF3741 domain-containing protein n=1 Tax=Capsella rubella TaxID=81985 RepID=R0GMX9_9BRAS|nr:protein LONGIFOLIA 1 [Capsella rubella]EOA12503.1 hypothetical protein CARUB_v10026137mg [Capsella rubella]